MLKSILAAATVSCAALALPSAASAATLVGNSITCETSTGPGSSSCDTGGNGSVFVKSSTKTVANNTVEFFFRTTNAPNPLAEINFENDILTIKSFGQRAITGTILTFTNNTNPFLSVMTDSRTFRDRAKIVNGKLEINLVGYTFPSTESTVSFRVAAVPEPGTWMLMILGLGAVGFAMRRRQSVSTRFQFA